MGARERIEELLKPDGEVIGSKTRPGSNVRRVTATAPVEEARETFERLAVVGRESPVPGSSVRRVEIVGLGYVTYREESKSGPPSIDVKVSIEGLEKVKFKFVADAGEGT